ncbi:hypothetical protein F2Q69_00001235 [Brassica cretica]|uniref:BTB domain-containing protein n=1 Tax=Brassica cretica TaxID=69181 RepID=A0A8S9P5N6_BRACR|nr:hypothetical protein F2Q69_00001235 [Brassica cretica]
MDTTSELSSMVRLNIGGKKFCTTIDTLTNREPDSMLAAMFSGRHAMSNESKTVLSAFFCYFNFISQPHRLPGYVFIDRDGKHFRHILNWLRDGIAPTLSDPDCSELLREVDYYQLLGLKEILKASRRETGEVEAELTRVDIIKCIQSERVRFRGVNLSGIDLSKLDLSLVDFSYACLRNVFFSRTNLQLAKFRDADAGGSIFHNAILRECEFTGANLRGALLAGTSLQSANLQGGKKFCTTIDTLTNREPDSMLAAMFSGRHAMSNESKTGYIFIDRDGKHFRHILNWLRDGIAPTLSDPDCSELLREADYYQLLGLKEILKSSRRETGEVEAELTRVDIIKCIQSERVRFRGVNLSGIDLSKLDLSLVDFSYACLRNVFFSRTNLQLAKFRDADAGGSIFHNAILRECEFTGANLRGALLAGTSLQSANLQGALY